MIPKTDWRTFFDAVSSTLTGKQVRIEAASLELGDQVVAEWLPLLGITYDSQDDLFDVSLGSEYNHLIRRPRQVLVQEGPRGIETIALVAEDGVQHTLRLKDPVMLPGPSKEHASSGGR
jgi:hypothetical protein